MTGIPDDIETVEEFHAHVSQRRADLVAQLGKLNEKIKKWRYTIKDLIINKRALRKELADIDRGKVRASKGWYTTATKQVKSGGRVLEYEYIVYRRYVSKDYRPERILGRADGKPKRKRKRSRSDRRRKK